MKTFLETGEKMLSRKKSCAIGVGAFLAMSIVAPSAAYGTTLDSNENSQFRPEDAPYSTDTVQQRTKYSMDAYGDIAPGSTIIPLSRTSEDLDLDNTVFVSLAFSDEVDPDGTIEAPYHTIQQALEATEGKKTFLVDADGVYPISEESYSILNEREIKVKANKEIVGLMLVEKVAEKSPKAALIDPATHDSQPLSVLGGTGIATLSIVDVEAVASIIPQLPELSTSPLAPAAVIPAIPTENEGGDPVSSVSRENNSASRSGATTTTPTAPYYASCEAVAAAGKGKLLKGEPGYGNHLDRDGDGIACEHLTARASSPVAARTQPRLAQTGSDAGAIGVAAASMLAVGAALTLTTTSRKTPAKVKVGKHSA